MHNANLRGIDCYQSFITRKARENRELKQATFLTKRTPAGVNRAVMDGESGSCLKSRT